MRLNDVSRNRSQAYGDDIFDQSRMSFGDHIEELRRRLILALYGLGFCLIIGFVLDYIGIQTGVKAIGIGRPMMDVITEPVKSQVRAFYQRRLNKNKDKLPAEFSTLEAVADARKRLANADMDMSLMSSEDKKLLRSAPQTLPISVNKKELKEAIDVPAQAGDEESRVIIEARVLPAFIGYLADEGNYLLESRSYLTSLSTQESFMVYFKVSLLCGAILASPWIFYHVWAFVAAGLYPHEKKYVHYYLPLSVVLFLTGVILCQLVVLPGAVKALLGFNDLIDIDPELRLNEWLGFALLLPVVFGLSFQTPLVMFFLSRIRLLTYDIYLKFWRYAVFGLAVFSAVITPTPDVVTMMYLFVPMFGLYMFGIGLCYLFPPPSREEDDEEAQIGV